MNKEIKKKKKKKKKKKRISIYTVGYLVDIFGVYIYIS